MYSQRHFGPDRNMLSEHHNSEIKEILGIIGGIIAFCVGFYFDNLRKEHWYDSDEYDMFNTLKYIFFIVGAVIVLCSIIGYFASKNSRSMIEQSYVTLYDDRIVGNVNDDYMQSFTVAWDDVICAYTDNYNVLVIKTITGSKRCPCIENIGILQEMINERVSKKATETMPVPEKEIVSETKNIQSESPSGNYKFCMWCGHKLPAEAFFCGGCGKKQ